MKYEIIRILFDWYNTPLLYLTPFQIITMIVEFMMVMKVVKKIFFRKKVGGLNVKNKR